MKNIRWTRVDKDSNFLKQELSKLSEASFLRIMYLWEIRIEDDAADKTPKISLENKDEIIELLLDKMTSIFYIKGVLEKLSSIQSIIYMHILASKTEYMTLGDIARKMSMPTMNVEIELGVLKRYFLVFQRKNRERLTNNADRYYYYPEIAVSIKNSLTHGKDRDIRIKFADVLLGQPLQNPWRSALGLSGDEEELVFDRKLLDKASEEVKIQKIIDALSSVERELINTCFFRGGFLEINQAREILRFHKQDWVPICRKLNDIGFLVDYYYLDKRFFRVLILTEELFEFLSQHPIPTTSKEGVRRKRVSQISNNFDFLLNIKKLVVYISRKGINLSKSGKIKQVDLRDSEESLVHVDTDLFTEKSQIYQVELLLPILRNLNIVRIKNDYIVLRNDYEKILKADYMELLSGLLKVIFERQQRHVYVEDVFEAIDLPFPEKELWDECIEYIQKKKVVLHKVVLAHIIRTKLLQGSELSIQELRLALMKIRKSYTSVFFYLHLFGLISVNYPERFVQISELGAKYLENKDWSKRDNKGCLIINSDLSLVVIPEKISVMSLLIVKAFCEFKSFDNIYIFQITRTSFQNGIAVLGDAKGFMDVLRKNSKSSLSQSLLFSTREWSKSLPVISIVDECVLVQTQERQHMELLLGQIANKAILQEEISPKTIMIHVDRIPEVIQQAEKLNLIVKLVR